MINYILGSDAPVAVRRRLPISPEGAEELPAEEAEYLPVEAAEDSPMVASD